MRPSNRHIAIPLLLAAWGLLLLGGVLHDLHEHHLDEVEATCDVCVAAAHAAAIEETDAATPALTFVGLAPETDASRGGSVLDRDHPVRAPPVLS